MVLFPPTFLDSAPPAVTDRSAPHFSDEGWSLLLSTARPLRLADAVKERRLTADQARRLLHALVANVKPLVTTITEALVAGKTKLTGWFRSMRDALIPGHFAGSLAVLNEREPSPADLASIIAASNGQIGFLERFRKQLASAVVLLGAGAVARAGMYAEALWSVAQNVLRGKKVRDKFTAERNVLGLADHCPSCLTQTRQGWVPIGTLIPVGSRFCLSHCRCHLEFRA